MFVGLEMPTIGPHTLGMQAREIYCIQGLPLIHTNLTPLKCVANSTQMTWTKLT